MERSRGRIKELLAVFFRGDPEWLRFFEQCLEDEVCDKDFCRICHEDMLDEEAIEDKCVVCEADDVCKLCTQLYDPAHLPPGETPPSRCTHWPFPLLTRKTPIKSGDRICILCGLYTSDPILIKKYLIMNMACGATDVLLNRKQPFSLKTVALIGWSLVSRMKKLGKWTDGIMTNIGRYLSFAEESKLMVAMLHQKEFVCLCNPSGRRSNHASHQTGEVFSSPMLDDYGQIIFRPLLRHVPWADHFC